MRGERGGSDPVVLRLLPLVPVGGVGAATEFLRTALDLRLRALREPLPIFEASKTLFDTGTIDDPDIERDMRDDANVFLWSGMSSDDLLAIPAVHSDPFPDVVATGASQPGRMAGYATRSGRRTATSRSSARCRRDIDGRCRSAGCVRPRRATRPRAARPRGQRRDRARRTRSPISPSAIWSRPTRDARSAARGDVHPRRGERAARSGTMPPCPDASTVLATGDGSRRTIRGCGSCCEGGDRRRRAAGGAVHARRSARFDDATITTIHGFCQQALAQAGSAVRQPIPMPRSSRAPTTSSPRCAATSSSTSSSIDPRRAVDRATKAVSHRSHRSRWRPHSSQRSRPLISNPAAIVVPDPGCDDDRRPLGAGRHRGTRRGPRRVRTAAGRSATTGSSPTSTTRWCTRVTAASVARQLADRFAVVLVDEFQDTDRVQWTIFERAFSGRHARHRRRPEAGDLPLPRCGRARLPVGDRGRTPHRASPSTIVRTGSCSTVSSGSSRAQPLGDERIRFSPVQAAPDVASTTHSDAGAARAAADGSRRTRT